MSQTIQPAAIRKSLTVKASPEKAFAVFTDGFDRWWPRSHTIDKSPLKRAVIEPRQGGRWYGLNEDGVESPWGEVLAWEPPVRLLLAWRINGKFTYDPAVLTEVEVRFTPEGDGLTRVDFEHRHLERLGEGGEKARAAMGGPGGWGGILERFKTAVEA
jgi:uncharacterized protein YndB with AHSA1/START domain